jgi:hypothetical protein
LRGRAPTTAPTSAASRSSAPPRTTPLQVWVGEGGGTLLCAVLHCAAPGRCEGAAPPAAAARACPATTTRCARCARCACRPGLRPHHCSGCDPCHPQGLSARHGPQGGCCSCAAFQRLWQNVDSWQRGAVAMGCCKC